MADNYLENKYDEYRGRDARKVVVKRIGQPLENLLRKNRSFRGYAQQPEVTREMLENIVKVKRATKGKFLMQESVHCILEYERKPV